MFNSYVSAFLDCLSRPHERVLIVGTILDGNHRVAALMRTKGDDSLVQCQFYSDIQDINNVNGIVADGETIECE